MTISFLRLSGELRNKIYELVLVNTEPVKPWFAADEHYFYDTQLLRTNKIVYHEASSIFYGQNNFDFTKESADNIPRFLSIIGRHNAEHIRHIRIHFPNFLNPPSEVVLFGERQPGFMTSVRDLCTDLRTITMTAESMDHVTFMLHSIENKDTAIRNFNRTNNLLRGFSPLEKIVVEVHDDCNQWIKGLMLEAGWEVKLVGDRFFLKLLGDVAVENSDDGWEDEDDADDSSEEGSEGGGSGEESSDEESSDEERDEGSDDELWNDSVGSFLTLPWDSDDDDGWADTIREWYDMHGNGYLEFF